MSAPAEEELPDKADDSAFAVTDGFIREIDELLAADYIDRIHELCRDIAAVDAADLLAKLGGDARRKLVEILDDTLPPDTFTYLPDDVRHALLSGMADDHVAAVVNGLESDDAIRLIDDLDADRRAAIMRRLSRRVRAVVEEGLTFGEYTAGRLMQREFVAIPQFWTVGKTVDYLRAAAEALPDKFYDIFIVDPMHRLVGAVALDDILCTQRGVKMDAIVNEEHVTIPAGMYQEEIAQIFRRKDLLSAPVVDDAGRLIGVITVDDVIDVIDEEATEDLLKLGGVTDSDIHRSTLSTARARSTWLFVNLFTAFIAAGVISLFESSIEKIVALAILMPIVASMGGNAGTQAMTVAVRALATKDLSAANAWRVVGKEAVVGMINGALFALLLGGAVYGWFGNWALGAVIACALCFNLLVAGFFGALIPIMLDRLGLDPAPAAGVLMTTVTDVIGFCAFLGLATLFLL